MQKFIKTVFYIVLILSVISSLNSIAATITVNTTIDDNSTNGNCSLREAIQAANTNSIVDSCTGGSGDDVISVPSGTYALGISGRDDDTCATGDLDINSNLTINGTGAKNTIIDAGGIDRVFHITGDYEVVINVLTVKNGYLPSVSGADHGGGIYNEKGDLTLNYCHITENQTAGSDDDGGGIFSGKDAYSSKLTINNSTISNNSAGDDGGGVVAKDRLFINNSTISNNTSGDRAGGIYLPSGDDAGSLDSVTISNNSASGNGGGLWVSSKATLNLKNSIIANNASKYTGDDWYGPINSQDYNIIKTLTDCSSCNISGTTSHNRIADPKLNPLADNEGSAPTHSFQADSVAKDNGSTDLKVDQRGKERPFGNADDIGAYEFVVEKEPDINDGLVAYYPFNGNANDESGNGHDGIEYGATLTSDRFGNPISAFSFDGVDDYIKSTIGKLSVISISLWFNTQPPVTHYPRLFDYGENKNFVCTVLGNHPTYIAEERVGKLSLSSCINPNTSELKCSRIESDIKPAYNEWHHLYALFDSQKKKQVMYINGGVQGNIQIGEDLEDSTTSIQFGHGSAFGNVGDENFFPEKLLKGMLDDIRIYNRALSETEIQLLYNEDSPPCNCPDADQDGIVDQWDSCDETPQNSAVYPDGCRAEDLYNLLAEKDQSITQLSKQYNQLSETHSTLSVQYDSLTSSHAEMSQNYDELSATHLLETTDLEGQIDNLKNKFDIGIDDKKGLPEAIDALKNAAGIGSSKKRNASGTDE